MIFNLFIHSVFLVSSKIKYVQGEINYSNLTKPIVCPLLQLNLDSNNASIPTFCWYIVSITLHSIYFFCTLFFCCLIYMDSMYISYVYAHSLFIVSNLCYYSSSINAINCFIVTR